MRQTPLLIGLLACLLVVGVAFGQDDGEPPPREFEVIGEIGQPRPQGIRYNQPLDQFVWVDRAGQLVLVDAATLTTQHVLYERGNYNAYRFSNSGRHIAVAIDRRIDVWDTITGELDVDFEADGTLSTQRPLIFSDDDSLLLITTVVPAPQSVRRSENDTVLLPWLWDIEAARGNRRTILSNNARSLPFFDYRNGLVFGSGDTIIASLPERLQILQLRDGALEMRGDLVDGRSALDPINLWESYAGGAEYVQPSNTSSIIQVDTRTGLTYDFRIGATLGAGGYSTMQDWARSPLTRVIGDYQTYTPNALLELLLGTNYPQFYDNSPLTVTLIDILDPVTLRPDNIVFLLHVFNHETDRGEVIAARAPAWQVAVHPDNDRVLIRRASQNPEIPGFDVEVLEVYDLNTGALLRTIDPAIKGQGLSHVTEWDATGEIIISDFERFDAATGNLLSQDLTYTNPFDVFYWSEDGTQLITVTGNDWWVWDLATRQVVQRADLEIFGTLISTWPDGSRYLSFFGGDETTPARTAQVYYPASDERYTVRFDTLTDRTILDIVPSPDWEHFLVVYTNDRNATSFRGDAIALYSLREGRQWVIADDDLPPADGRNYGWIDGRTVYIGSSTSIDGRLPRVFGADYDASGVPACLVRAYPDGYTRWVDDWERLTVTIAPDRLARLSIEICDIIPDDEIPDPGVIDIALTPTMTPTPFNATPTPALVAGVPSCLTLRFPQQALDYSQDWRRLTEGLTPEQVAELETLLCQNLSGAGELPDEFFEDPPIVMTIDIFTQQRSSGNFVPAREQTRQPIFPVANEFQRVEDRSLNDPKLAPDLQTIAELNGFGYIRLYRMNVPYGTLIADLTATAVAQVERQNLISVRPTSTEPFAPLGTPRPTVTPTITPTDIPRTWTPVPLSDADREDEVCPVQRLFTMDDLPPDWEPDGFIVLSPQQIYDFGSYIPVTPTSPPPPLLPTLDAEGTPLPIPTFTPTPAIFERPLPPTLSLPYLWILDPTTGERIPNERLPVCDGNNTLCDYSSNGEWMIVRTVDAIRVMRVDGTEVRELLANPGVNYLPFAPQVAEGEPTPIPPPNQFDGDVRWLGGTILQLTTTEFVDNPNQPERVQRVFDVAQGGDLMPLEAATPIRINERRATSISRQPVHGSRLDGEPITLGRWVMAYLEFPTDTFATDLRIYMVDTDTDEATYFARSTTTPSTFWSADGTQLFYRFPDDADWSVFDTTTQTHQLYGSLPGGATTTDDRYRADWYFAPPNLIRERQEAEELWPKLQVYDTTTGSTWRYCLPGVSEVPGTSLTWSPDGRYLAFSGLRTVEVEAFGGGRITMFILDTATGHVVDMGYVEDETTVQIWMAGEGRPTR